MREIRRRFTPDFSPKPLLLRHSGDCSSGPPRWSEAASRWATACSPATRPPAPRRSAPPRSPLSTPLDTVKTLLQLSATGPKQKMGLRQVVDRLMSASGTAGLYSGLGWSMLGRLPGLGARFGTYEILTAFYKDGREDNHVYYSEAMLAGITAGAVESVMCTPFELLKLRNQVGSAITLKATGPANITQESFPLLSKLLPGYVPDIRVWNSTVNLLSNLSPKHPDIMGSLKQFPETAPVDADWLWKAAVTL